MNPPGSETLKGNSVASQVNVALQAQVALEAKVALQVQVAFLKLQKHCSEGHWLQSALIFQGKMDPSSSSKWCGMTCLKQL